MNDSRPTCQWCNDRAGGCLHCPDDRKAGRDEAGEKLRQSAHTLFADANLKYYPKAIARHPNGRDIVVMFPDPMDDPAHPSAPDPQPSTPIECDHVWKHLREDLNRRTCIRPGCGARQHRSSASAQWFFDVPDDLQALLNRQPPANYAKNKTKADKTKTKSIVQPD